MRDKEAVEAERKSLARNAEKQAKLIDKLMETEKNLTSQLVCCSSLANDSLVLIFAHQSALDKEFVAVKKICDAHRERVVELERDIPQWQARVTVEKQRTDEVLIKLRT
jgi:E3 ubiquitin-protein ligase BRE1